MEQLSLAKIQKNIITQNGAGDRPAPLFFYFLSSTSFDKRITMAMEVMNMIST